MIAWEVGAGRAGGKGEGIKILCSWFGSNIQETKEGWLRGLVQAKKKKEGTNLILLREEMRRCVNQEMSIVNKFKR